MVKIKMNKKKQDKTLEEGFKEFLRHCKVKNLSESTIKFYKSAYNYYFSQFLPKDTLIKTIDKTTIEEFILFMKDNYDLNNTSINSRLRGIRSIINYWIELGYLNKFKIDLLRTQEKIKEVYSDEQLEKLLVKPNIKKYSSVEYRSWVIVNYLLATGNRVKTLTEIKIKDLDFESGYINLRHTKNKKAQVIPLSNSLIKILKEYLDYREGEQEDYLFCTVYGKKISPETVKKSIARYNRNREVKITSIHAMRHTFAKKWILSGGDIFRLQKILGHSSIEMVKNYINMFKDDLKQDFNKFNPLEQMNKHSKTIKLK
ncbi:integrase [Orenia metallireducens]|uniref:Integrase n=1 Tax=Orenia metallireducens TaxID=1413210 RepID=A0A1C0AB27_9FIRM|nr:tyrosine-type recombinase/integrase [Orenia metallireducens]OCL27577.1 integrase [Orenia metallireducens]